MMTGDREEDQDREDREALELKVWFAEERATAIEETLDRERARREAAERRLDEIGRDIKIVRGGLVKRHIVEVPKDVWMAAVADAETLDRQREWRPVRSAVVAVVSALAGIGVLNMAAQAAQMLWGQ